MLRSVDEAIRESGGQLIDDPDLVTENCFLVESTNAVCGTFADSFWNSPMKSSSPPCVNIRGTLQ